MNIFKNYFWLLLVILSCQGILQAEDNQDCDCASSTQYVMQFLAKSGTKWRGNKEWLKDLKKGAFIETNYLHIHDTKTRNSKTYTGYLVRAYNDNFTGRAFVDTIKDRVNATYDADLVKAMFAITQDDDGFVIITSLINDTTEKKVTDLQKTEELKSNIKKCNGTEKQNQDGYSECHYKTVAEFNDTTNLLKVTLASSCTTKMPLDLFIKEIEKNRNGFN